MTLNAYAMRLAKKIGGRLMTMTASYAIVGVKTAERSYATVKLPGPIVCGWREECERIIASATP